MTFFAVNTQIEIQLVILKRNILQDHPRLLFDQLKMNFQGLKKRSLRVHRIVDLTTDINPLFPLALKVKRIIG